MNRPEWELRNRLAEQHEEAAERSMQASQQHERDGAPGHADRAVQRGTTHALLAISERLRIGPEPWITNVAEGDREEGSP